MADATESIPPEVTPEAASETAPKANLGQLGDEIVKILEAEARQFILGNKEDALALGEDVVKAVLFKKAYEHIPIPSLPKDASEELRAAFSEILLKRDEVSQLIAAAQRQHSERLDRIEKNASAAGVRIVAAVLALGLKAVLGG